jgi:hypothetical protein
LKKFRIYVGKKFRQISRDNLRHATYMTEKSETFGTVKAAETDGTAAATPGTAARRDEGKEPYSPSQPLDWSENLDGVRRIMKIYKPKAPSQRSALT